MAAGRLAATPGLPDNSFEGAAAAVREGSQLLTKAVDLCGEYGGGLVRPWNVRLLFMVAALQAARDGLTSEVSLARRGGGAGAAQDAWLLFTVAACIELSYINHDNVHVFFMIITISLF